MQRADSAYKHKFYIYFVEDVSIGRVKNIATQPCFPFTRQDDFRNLQFPQNPIKLETNQVTVFPRELFDCLLLYWDEEKIKNEVAVFILGPIS